MSLTSHLKTDTEIRRLFTEIPNLKPFFHTLNEGPAFPPNASSTILIKRNGPSNPAIGHAYDYWLRAYVQRINGMHEERCPSDLTASIGIALLKEHGTDLTADYVSVINRRNAYIQGQLTDESDLLHDCLLLANLETFFRSGYLSPEGVTSLSEWDYADLRALADETKRHSGFFTARHMLNCNPTFGAASCLLGGADADLVIDNTLIEIKTESSFGYKAQHIRQLLAYYLLGRLTPTSEANIQRLAVFNPRYGRYIYLDIEEIAEEIKLKDFTARFVELLCQPDCSNGNPQLIAAQKDIWLAWEKSC